MFFNLSCNVFCVDHIYHTCAHESKAYENLTYDFCKSIVFICQMIVASHRREALTLYTHNYQSDSEKLNVERYFHFRK